MSNSTDHSSQPESLQPTQILLLCGAGYVAIVAISSLKYILSNHSRAQGPYQHFNFCDVFIMSLMCPLFWGQILCSLWGRNQTMPQTFTRFSTLETPRYLHIIRYETKALDSQYQLTDGILRELNDERQFTDPITLNSYTDPSTRLICIPTLKHYQIYSEESWLAYTNTKKNCPTLTDPNTRRALPGGITVTVSTLGDLLIFAQETGVLSYQRSGAIF